MIRYRSFFKPIALILVLSIIFQGCKVYYKEAATPEKAFESSNRVKIITVDDREMYFDKIIIEDDVLYGVRKIKGKSINIILSQSDIKEIHLIDLDKSKKKTRILILSCFMGVVIFFIIEWIIGLENYELNYP
jgi:hypothetical protein